MTKLISITILLLTLLTVNAYAGMWHTTQAYNAPIAQTDDPEENYYNMRVVYGETVRAYAAKKGRVFALTQAQQNIIYYLHRLDKERILKMVEYLEEGNPYSNYVKEMYYRTMIAVYNVKLTEK